MRLIKQVSSRIVLVCGLMLGLIVPVNASAEEKVAPKDRTVRGQFESFEDGVLTLRYYKARGESDLLSAKIPETAKTFVWNHDEGRYQPVDTDQAIRQLQALLEPVSTERMETAESLNWRIAGGMGLSVQIAGDNVTIRIGENKTPFLGNFVSFKDDFLFFRLKNRQFQKAYGDTVRFRMNESIAVYESIDGGEYQPIGTPRTAFGNVKEGATLSVFHNYKTETDEFYLVLVGVKKKQ